MNLFRNIFFAFLITRCLIACTPTDGNCNQDKGVLLGVALYKTTFDSQLESYVPSALTDTMTVYGLNNDSLLVNRRAINSLKLPLRSLDSVTNFVFQRDALEKDTITFLYDNTEQLISLECGCVIYHNIIDVKTTNHQIDSVTILNVQVNNTTNTHMRIYFNDTK